MGHVFLIHLVLWCPEKVQSLSVFWNLEEEDEEEVAQMIGSLPGIDWEGNLCSSVPVPRPSPAR
ncbi:hypothetical protein Hamer_G005503 [Homarus americanus]|uniref:Uncharacterized protein n=1 Tax=Homarus americanus TaxID=6706 RepID=A0A8J5K2Q7_HOMAM|nr:hypothetical protein Hamer_G005503 [Homarus americanus]